MPRRQGCRGAAGWSRRCHGPPGRLQHSADFSSALAFATALHAKQVRKQTGISYISHLISVAGLVLERGGCRDEAIAALLHDSIEDCAEDFAGGVEALRAHIDAEFGPAVLDIVEGCTDSETVPGRPSQASKERYLAYLAAAAHGVDLSRRIRMLRGHRVLLDSDLASLYGVPTSRFNEAVKRNAARFPSDVAFRLTAAEHDS